MATSFPTAPPPRAKLITAFAAVYILWGSTYLAIRLGVASFPPFVMAASRYLIAGALLLGWLALRGAKLPNARQWREAAIVGSFLLLGGNGLVCWAEQKINSSLAALILSTSPIWFAVFDTVRPGGRPPQLNTILGLVVGFGGVVTLVLGSPSHGSTSTSLAGVFALISACALWAGGSIYGKYHTQPASPWVTTGAQMLCGGAACGVTALVRGEWFSFHPAQVTTTSWFAFVYLVIFGSLFGFGAYVWLLEHCAPAKVATYAYVNPVVATLLGWLILGEPLTPIICLAALIILGGVLIVQWPMARAKDESLTQAAVKEE